jgi:hypothetical protein
MIERGYRWDFEAMRTYFPCTKCGKVKALECYGTSIVFRNDDNGDKVPFLYRRKECKRCRCMKENIRLKKKLQPTTTTKWSTQ